MISKKAEQVIIQFGRFDRGGYKNEISFNCDGYTGKSSLSALFLKQSVPKFAEAELLIIFPLSLVFQEVSIETKDEFSRKVLDANITYILAEPIKFYESHIHAQGNTILIVSSQGSFNKNGKTHEFDSDINHISCQIFLKLIKDFSYDELKEVSIEVSSGQNIYVAALINALYRFVPYIQFKRCNQTNNTPLKVSIINSDPIFPGITSVNLHFSEFRAKAFNSLTISRRGQLDSLIGKFDVKHKKLLRDLIDNEYPLIHICINNGLVLGFLLLEESTLENYDNSKDEIMKRLYDMYHDNIDIKPNFKFTFFDIVSFTFSLALLNAFYTLIKKNKILNTIKFRYDLIARDEKEEIQLNSESLNTIYEILEKNIELNKPNFQSEFKNLSPLILFAIKNKNESEYLNIGEIELEKNPHYKISRDINPRNFFAHFGLEKNITNFRVIENEIEFQYDQSIPKEKIKKSIIDYGLKK